MLREDEIVDTRDVRHLDVTVEAPGGPVKVTHVCKTISLPRWYVRTSRHDLYAADRHQVYVEGKGFTPVCELRLGDFLRSEDGLEAVLECEFTGSHAPMFDLRVESDQHEYFTDGLLSHNSTGLGARGIVTCNTKPYTSLLHVAPHPNQVKTFANRVKAMERGSAFDPAVVGSRGMRNNLYFKEYENNSSYNMQHVLTDIIQIRGITATELTLDEAQDFDAGLLEEVLQTLKDADYPSELYAGTSTYPESFLETQYQTTSRGVWHIPSPAGGGKWISLGDPDLLDDMIHIDGLRCPYSKQLVNPLLGEFVHEDQLALQSGKVGFHCPQLIVPAYATGDKWFEIYRDFKKYDRPKFLKEVMGIPVLSGMREITEADLKRMCGELSMTGMKNQIRQRQRTYRYIISGCDWGGSDYDISLKTKLSYTVHVMMGITPNGDLELFHVQRHSGKDYLTIADEIVKTHVEFGGYAIGTDFGMGMYYNQHIQASGAIPHERHIVWNYTGVANMLMETCQTEGAFINHIMLQKTESISALLSDIKRKGTPRITCPHWGEMKEYLTDFLNSFRNVKELDGGRTTVQYIRHGSKADDVMHAINFALCTARVILGESMIDNSSLLARLQNGMGLVNPHYAMGDYDGGGGYQSHSV